MNKKGYKKILAIFFLIIIVLFLFGITLVNYLKEQKQKELDDKLAGSEQMSDQELIDKAIIEVDSDYCNGIADETKKDACKNLFPDEKEKNSDVELVNQAIIEDNSEYCNEIVDEDKKKSCLNLFESTVNVNNESEDNNSSVNTLEINTDQEYYNDAILNDDVSYCYNILDQDKRKGCTNLFS